MKPYLFLIAAVLAISTSRACSCGRQGKLDKKGVEYAQYIFTGTVVDNYLDSLKRLRYVVFEVSENLKGTSKGERVTIITRSSSAACGITVENGESWYVFAPSNYPVDLPPDIDICGRSMRLTPPNFPATFSKSRRKQRQRIYRKNYARFKKDRRFIRRTKLT